MAGIVIRVVADHIDDSRRDELYRIGVDDVSYRKGQRYLTVVADHDRGAAVVWAGEGRSAKTLKAFYDQLGDDRKASGTCTGWLDPKKLLPTSNRGWRGCRCRIPSFVKLSETSEPTRTAS